MTWIHDTDMPFAENVSFFRMQGFRIQIAHRYLQMYLQLISKGFFDINIRAIYTPVIISSREDYYDLYSAPDV